MSHLLRILPATVAVLLGSALLPGSAGDAQPPRAATPAGPAPDRGLASVESCRLCHFDRELSGRVYKESLGFIRLNESQTWETADAHRDAFKALETPYARRMGEQLGWPDVTRQPACLTCHAVDLSPKTPPAQKRDDGFHKADGVNCVACHGLVNTAWREEHTKPRTWRAKPPEDKAKETGQIDLRDPLRRAAQCVSCHVGNHAEGKVLTHAMYAAGHPPLPGFELTTFSDDQPRHWNPPRDVPYLQTLPADQAWGLFHYRKDDNPQARAVVLGAAVTCRESFRLLHDEAAACPTEQLLDLANFDCYACHHDLKRPSWRQERGFGGRMPGRPVARPAPAALVRIALAQAGPAGVPLLADLDRLQKGLDAAFDRRPFGDPPAVADASQALLDWSDKAVGLLAEVRYTPDECRRLRAGIAAYLQATAGGRRADAPDYDAARQLVWAFNVINGELNDAPPAVAERLKALDARLPLHVRPKEKLPVAEQMKERLQRLNGFEPGSLREPFGAILKELPAAGPERRPR
jgi:hypothetical protein